MAATIEVLTGGASPWAGTFESDEITIGRHRDADVRLHATEDRLCASGVHCRLRRDAGGWRMEVEHANGVTVLGPNGATRFVGGGEQAPMRSGAEFIIGRGGPRLRMVDADAVEPPAAGLEVRIVSGAVAPWRGVFHQAQVLIGRGPEADVRLHPTLDVACASAIHARLEPHADRFLLTAVHRSGLSVRKSNGHRERVEAGRTIALSSEAEITLGQHGPRLRVVPLPEEGAVLPATNMAEGAGHANLAAAAPWLDAKGLGDHLSDPSLDSQGRKPNLASIIDSCVRRPRTALAAGGALLALLLALWWGASGGSDEERLRIALERAQGQVFIVVGLDASGEVSGAHGNGTAWAVGKGRLATNAHVAELVEEMRRADLRPVARRTVPKSQDLPIRATQIHPGWDRWKSVLGSQLITRSGQLQSMSAPFDVAILEVDGDVGRPLQLARACDLRHLGSGRAIGYVGFPTENVVGLSQNPPPTVAIGKVNKLTDVLGQKSSPEEEILVHFDMVVTGGASGSPILNRDGRVVGIVNAGNMVPAVGGTRISVGLNIGQRANLVAELLDGTAKGRQPARNARIQNQLKESMASPSQAAGIVARIVLEQLVKQAKVPPTARLRSIHDSEDVLRGGREHGRRVELRLQAGASYIVVASAEDFCNVDLAVVRGSQVLAADESPLWVGGFFYTAPASDTYALTAYAVRTHMDAPRAHIAAFLIEW